MQTTTERARSKDMHSPASREEVRKLVLKLRWMGMEDEAIKLGEELAEAAPMECPLIEPRDTD